MAKPKSFLKGIFNAAVVAGTLALASPSFAQEQPTDALPNGTTIEEVVQSVEDAAATQEQTTIVTTNDWSLEPTVPDWTLYGLGGMLALFGLYAGSRRMRGTFWYAAAGTAVVVTLANPQFIQEDREPLPTEIAIIVDRSDSQGLDGRDITTSEMYDRLIGQLGGVENISIRTIEVGGEAEGPQNGTNIITTLESGLSDIPRDRLGGVIMLTDGRAHDVQEWSNSLGENVPLHILVSGQQDELDRRVVLERSPRFGLVDEEQTITYRVVNDGTQTGADEPVRVVISVDGQQIDEQFVIPGQSSSVTLDLEHIGSNSVEIKADTIEGELTDINNRVVTSIEGIRESLNVLLVTGEPNQGTRVWRDLLKSDPDTDLVHFTILRTPEKDDYTPSEEMSLIPFPVQELFVDRIQDFDLIVFDTYEYRGLLPYFNNIANYVEQGGALLVINGEEFSGRGSIANTPLSRVLPASPSGSNLEQPYVPEVSDQGQRHPVTRTLEGSAEENPSWGRWFQQVDSESATGDVIMTGANGEPLLILERKDEGRVAMVMSDDTWLWARGVDGGGPHADLMRNIAHWLMGNPSLEEEDLKITHENGELIIEQQTMADASQEVTITTPSGERIQVQPEEASPGLWRIVVPAAEMGLYTAEIGGEHPDRAHVNVGPEDVREYQNTISTTEILAPLAEQTGGAITRMNNGDAELRVPDVRMVEDGEEMSGPDWIALRQTDASILKGVEKDPIIPPWLGLLVSMGLLAGAYHVSGGGKLFGRREKEGGDKNDGADTKAVTPPQKTPTPKPGA